MPDPVNIAQALERVSFLDGRTPDSDTADTFVTLGAYRDGGVFAGGFSGTSPWERHPDEEIVQVLDGAATISLALPGGIETRALEKGMIVIVPTGVWHRFTAPGGVTLMTVTPQPTEHTFAEMPPAD